MEKCFRKHGDADHCGVLGNNGRQGQAATLHYKQFCLLPTLQGHKLELRRYPGACSQFCQCCSLFCCSAVLLFAGTLPKSLVLAAKVSQVSRKE